MNKVISNIYYLEKIYYPEYESFCFQNGVRQILEYYGVKHAFLFINSTLSLLLKIDQQSKHGYDIFYNENSRSVLPNYSNKIIRHEDSSDNKIMVWEKNKLKIQNDEPIIIGVDAFFLNYLPFYNKNHTRHTVTLAGYDCDKKEVYIVDWYEPWFYKGTVNFNDFILSRNSQNPFDGSVYSGSPINNNWTEIKSDGWDDCPEKLLYDTVQISLDQYYITNNSNKGILQGILALEYLLTLIKAEELKSINEKKCFFNEMFKKIFTVPKRKKLFKLYLALYRMNFNIDFLDKSIHHLDQLINLWDALTLFILKCSQSNKDGAYLKIVNHLQEIINLEKELYSSLYEITIKIS
jgi:hypothetical protein